MVALNTLVLTGDSQKGNWLNNSNNTTGNYWPLISESFESPNDVDYIRGGSGSNDNNTQRYIGEFSNTNSDFLSMSNLTVGVRFRSFNIVNDTVGFNIRIINLANTELTNVVTATNITTSFQSNSYTFSLTAAGLAANKTDWDNARIVITQTYNQVSSPDNGYIAISALQLTGNYTNFNTLTRTASSTAQSSSSSSASRVAVASIQGAALSSENVDSSYTRVRPVSGEASSGEIVFSSFIIVRSVSGSAGSSEAAVYNAGFPVYDITVQSIGYFFYEYINIILISVSFDSAFDISILENADASVSFNFDSGFDVNAIINGEYSINEQILISSNSNMSVSANMDFELVVDNIDSIASLIISSIDTLRTGGGEDTSDIKAFFIFDNIPLTEHNRKTNMTTQIINISASNWRGKKSVYYKNKSSKKTFTFQWSFVPGERRNTVDLNAGRNYIQSKSLDPSLHVLEIRNLDTNGLTPNTTEVYNVLVSEYTENLVRRDIVGDDYYWDCSLSLQEV